MLKRAMCYVLCFVILATVSPVNLLAETVLEPAQTTQTPEPLAEAEVSLEPEPMDTPAPKQEPPATKVPAATEKQVVTEPPADPPANDASVSEEPKQEAPPKEEPLNDEPEQEVPVTDEPISEEPVIEPPVTNEPILEEPVTETPVNEEPIPDEPVTEPPVTDEPVLEEPVTEPLVTEEPVPEEPVTEPSVTDEPVLEEPVTETPVTDEPVLEEPVTEPPVTDEPVSDELVTEEPIDEPLVDEIPIEEIPAYFTPQTAAWDLALPGENLVITLTEGAPIFLGIENLTLDVDYTLTGSDIVLEAAYLNALPVGQTTLSLLFEGDVIQNFYLNIADSSAPILEEPVPEVVPEEELADMSLMAMEMQEVNPIVFDKASLESTRFWNGERGSSYFGSVYLTGDVSEYGTPIWSLTDLTGTSVSNISLSNDTGVHVNVYYEALTSAGITSATLTCTVGEFTQSLPIIITVSDVSVPTGMTVQPLYSGTVNQPILIPRPETTPAETGLLGSNLIFNASGSPDSKTGDSSTGYQFTYSTPGYYTVYLSMSYENVYLSKSIVLAVADEAGTVPGNLIEFEETPYEQTLYMGVPGNNESLHNVYLASDLSNFGTPVWELSNVSGTSVKDLRVQHIFTFGVALSHSGLVSTGITTATLTCSVGEYSASLPITITVMEASVPQTMQTDSYYSGVINTPITVNRPVLQPAETDVSESLFRFDLNMEYSFYEKGNEMSGNSAAGYELNFVEAGYYNATVVMSYLNIQFSQSVLFSISDTSGQVPGDLIELSKERVDSVLYLNPSESYSQSFYIRQDRELSSFGTGVWSVSNMSGDSVSSIQIGNDQNPYYCFVVIGKTLKAGITTATLTYTVGSYSKSIPIHIEVSEIAVPTSIQGPSEYEGRVNVPITVTRPALVPADTGLTSEQFAFWLHSNQGLMTGDLDTDYQITFDQPGYYTARIEMSYANLYFQQDILFKIADENGQMPTDLLQFVDESKTFTYYLAGSKNIGSLQFPFKKHISALGKATAKLSNVNGTSVTSLVADTNSYDAAFLFIDRILSAGTTTATLTCEAGGFSDSVDIIINVIDAPIPSSIDLPSSITSIAGDTTSIAFPSLLPANTGIDNNLFAFSLYGPQEVAITSNGSGYSIVASTPGYYTLSAYMSYANIRLDKSILLKVTDATGQVPGSPIKLSTSSYEETHTSKVPAISPIGSLFINIMICHHSEPLLGPYPMKQVML